MVDARLYSRRLSISSRVEWSCIFYAAAAAGAHFCSVTTTTTRQLSPIFPAPSLSYLTTRNKTQNDTTLLHDKTRHDAMRCDTMRHSHCEVYDVVQSVNLNKTQTNTTVPIRIPTRSFINDELHIIGVWQQQQQRRRRRRHQTRVLSFCMSMGTSGKQ